MAALTHYSLLCFINIDQSRLNPGHGKAKDQGKRGETRHPERGSVKGWVKDVSHHQSVMSRHACSHSPSNISVHD